MSNQKDTPAPKSVQGEAVAWQRRYAHKLPNGGMTSWQWVTKAEYDARDKPWPDPDYEWRELFTQPPAPAVQIAAPGDVEHHVSTLRKVCALLKSLPNVQGREHVDLGIQFNNAIKYFAALQPQGQADMADTERLDYIERTFSGMTNRERYLPVQMIWGKGCNGRTLREACDKYMKRAAALAQQANKDKT